MIRRRRGGLAGASGNRPCTQREKTNVTGLLNVLTFVCKRRVKGFQDVWRSINYPQTKQVFFSFYLCFVFFVSNGKGKH